MIKRVFFLVFALFIVFTPVVYAQAQNIKRLPASEIIENDYFSFGDRVEILGTVAGDLYTAGEEVFMGGVVTSDMLVAAGDVRISGVVNGDLRAVGGKVLIDGSVDGNVTSAGGTIELSQGAEVKGNIVTAGGEVIIAGPIEGNLTVAAGNLYISGVINGNSQIRAEKIQIGPGAKVNGDLTYWSENDAVVDSSASISGSVSQNKTQQFNKNSWRKGIAEARDGANIFSKLVSIFTTSVIGFILLKYFPRYTDRGIQTIMKKPKDSFIVGILSLLAIPLITLLLIVTVIGFPLAFGFFILSMLYLFMSRIIGIMAIGTFLSKKANFKKMTTMYIFIIGLVCYYALDIIPVVGNIIQIVIILVSFGGALINEKKTYKLSKKLGAY